jgi:hypothetical protein
MQWVDPPSIVPNQNYIDYLKDIIIYNLKRELGEALARLDPPSSEDDGCVTGPMVFKMNTDCEDEYFTCPCHESRTTLHQQLHPHHLHLHLHPCLGTGTTCPPSTVADLCSLGTSPTNRLVSNVVIVF